jgi:hypothetical protein
MDVYNGVPFATPDAAEFLIKLIPSKARSGALAEETVFIMANKANSGTVQFSFNEAITANHHVLAAGEKHPPRTVPLDQNYIRCKGSAIGQYSTITW